MLVRPVATIAIHYLEKYMTGALLFTPDLLLMALLHIYKACYIQKDPSSPHQ